MSWTVHDVDMVDDALDWLTSYNDDRVQSVHIHDALLGPLSLVVKQYIVCQNNMKYHYYWHGIRLQVSM